MEMVCPWMGQADGNGVSMDGTDGCSAGLRVGGDGNFGDSVGPILAATNRTGARQSIAGKKMLEERQVKNWGYNEGESRLAAVVRV
jgi:hypothetical protein